MLAQLWNSEREFQYCESLLLLFELHHACCSHYYTCKLFFSSSFLCGWLVRKLLIVTIEVGSNCASI
jgi:hypothetical protein